MNAISISQRPCWNCRKVFRAGIAVGTAGICSDCIQASGVNAESLSASLPHVWGERSSRLSRAIKIIKALNAEL